jgi:ribonuclease-3
MSHTGHGNNLISTIGSNANLATPARNAGIDQHVLLDPGHMGRVSDKTLATTIEAKLGAVYLNTAKDMESVSRVMIVVGLST